MTEKAPIFQRKLKRVASVAKNEEFSVVTYNILCDSVFIENEAIYRHVADDEKLRGPDPTTSVRHIQLMKELKWLDADILCFQEVDSFYFPHLVHELSNHGYQGVFKRHIEDMDNSDGVATFFKTKKFTMLESKTYGFNELLGQFCDLNQFEDSNKPNQRFTQYTILQDAQTGKKVAIVNVHLIFCNWREPDVHAMQAALFFQQLHAILPPCSKNTTPWIVCGDFNMRPNFPCYELVGNGKLSDESCQKLSPAKCKYPQLTEHKEVKKYNSIVLQNYKKNLSHPFETSKSAYKSVLGNEPVFTHYECDELFPELFGFDIMKDTLDYIWYSSNTLQANAVLEMVKEEVIKPFKACPNKIFPSDHLSLKACFQFL